MKKVLFLDRDGVVNVDHGYAYQIEQFEFIDGVFNACLAFQQAGFEIVIITNQSGIGRGYYTEQDFHQLTDWMVAQFAAQGIQVLDVFFCPHHPKKALAEYLLECDCRKPAPGMLLQAIEKHAIDPSVSMMVGDKISDMQAATAANIGSKYLVRSGQEFSVEDAAKTDGVFDSLSHLAKERLS